MNPPSDDLDPARLESAAFELVRRGFDPTAVRAELQRAAQEIRRLRLERDELAGRLSEFDDVSAGQLEPHRVAEALGVEAMQVLEAAHLAAKERAERAEREADGVRDEARAAADTTRAEAHAARDRLVEEARREAESIMEDGRERGRDMVTEAQTVRERMLRDLARKRQTGRAQVEQLRAGRDRLLESLTIAQQALDTAVVDLVNSVPEARSAAERAGLRITAEPTPTSEELEGEIGAARVVGHPLLDEVADLGPVEDTFITGEMEALTHLDALDDEEGEIATIAVPGELDEEAGPSETPESAEEVASSQEGASAAEDEAVEEHEAVEESAAVGDEATVVDEPIELYDVESEESDESEPIADEGDSAEEGAVVDVFTKLRSAQETVGDETGADPTEADDRVGPAAADEEVDAEPEPEPALESVSDPAGAGVDAARATARAAAADEAAKAMKKVLVEEQGTLLDGIRRSGAAAVRFVADDVAAHETAYDKAASPALRNLAAALGGSRRLRLSDAFAQIHAIALEPVRQRLADVAERVTDPDELSDTVRALYRESRSRRIPEAAAAAAVAVDAMVVVASTRGLVEWHVDPDGPCGPDCADNALAGALASGAVFPTGDSHPPAHPACTCWLAAVGVD